jgi:threonine/homoserine/homoserine lactone efflux protein
MFFLAFSPQFTSDNDPIFLKSLFLASIQFFIGLVWLITLSIFILKIKNFMLKLLISKVFKSFTGSIFILFGIKLALEDSK